MPGWVRSSVYRFAHYSKKITGTPRKARFARYLTYHPYHYEQEPSPFIVSKHKSLFGLGELLAITSQAPINEDFCILTGSSLVRALRV